MASSDPPPQLLSARRMRSFRRPDITKRRALKATDAMEDALEVVVPSFERNRRRAIVEAAGGGQEPKQEEEEDEEEEGEEEEGEEEDRGDEEEEEEEEEVSSNNNIEERRIGNSFKQLGRSKTLLITSSGQCSTKQHEADEERELDYEEEEACDGGAINGGKSTWPPFFFFAKHRSSTTSSSSPGLLLSFLLRLKKQQSSGSKKIDATQGVLATYHDSFLYGKVPLTTKVRAAIRGRFWSTLLLVLESLAAIFLLTLYVRSTYTAHNQHWITIGQLVCSFFFILDYLIKLYSAPVRLYYVLSVNGIIDFISTLPVYFILGGVMADAAIPEVFLILRVLRGVPLLSKWALPGGAVGQEIFLLLAYSFGVFFIAAGVLQWVELRATPASVKQENGCPAYGCISFYEAFYFIVVTVSTVGYGDITLKSDWGRLIALLTILAAVLLIPLEVNKILDIASRRPYGGRYAVRKVVGSRFIIVSGNLSFRAVEDFLSEFYHPSHAEDMRAFPFRVVIMAPFKPSFEMKVLLTEYKGRVEFIEGTPLKDSDLERVSANMSSAFFLMADHQAEDLDAEDAAQIMRTLSVHRFCGSKVRVIVEMLKPENQDNAIWDDAEGGIEIVCPEAICYQLLARSCQIKGITTLVINLFKSGLKVQNTACGHWMQQYCHGQQQEIYPVILPCFFHENQLTFQEIAEIIYLEFQIILFGLDISLDDESDTREVLLYPRERIIQRNDVGLVIAEDLAVTEKISTLRRHHTPAWYAKLYKACNKTFKGSFNEADMLPQKVTGNRGHIQNYDIEGDSSGSEYRQRQISGSFGMMSSGHRADLQMRLREIVCASTIHELGSDGNDLSTPGEKCKGGKEQLPQEPRQIKRVYSLEEAVDTITRWPPLKHERPDRPILERRAEAILKNLQERTINLVTLSKPHVLVCMQGNWPANLFCFVAHLRSSNLPNPPVVIIHPVLPSTEDWGCIGMFEEVYFLQGSPLYEIDLLRGGVLQAQKVVVLTQRGTAGSAKDATSEDNGTSLSSTVILDIDSIMITATVERLLHPVRDGIIVELHRETEIHYLRPKFRISPHRFDPFTYNRNRSATFLFAPAFIAGKGFSSASLTFLLYALFFNRNTVAITEKLISGGDVIITEKGEKIYGPKLDQIPLPKAYDGQTFENLFIGLLHAEHKLAIGLYRPVGTCKSVVSYVYTNPPREEIVQGGDLVYVLH